MHDLGGLLLPRSLGSGADELEAVLVSARSRSTETLLDAMRDKWKAMLTGGASLDESDEDVVAAVEALAAEANEYWMTMDSSSGRSCLWSEYPSFENSTQIRKGYARLRKLALAYTTNGSSLYGNASLGADIVRSLEYMYATRYHEGLTPTQSEISNWWDWEIGIPMDLNDIVVLMANSLSREQVTRYMNSVERFTPRVSLTGANRSWKAIIVGVRGVIVRDEILMAAARDGLSDIFIPVTSGDGFYVDGSFLQHNKVPYTGGYGLSLLRAVSNLMTLLHGSPWQVMDPNHSRVWEWIVQAYQPLIYKGAMMDMVRGREIARHYQQDHQAGHLAIQGILQLSTIAPEPYAIEFKRMIRGWIKSDKFLSVYKDMPIGLMPLAKEIEDDSSITPAGELIQYRQFPGMDRAVQHRPGYSFGLAMYSNRTYSYEAMNGENGKGWYTSSGATSLYNGDLGHYSEDFWPTIDSYRLPGTTVLSRIGIKRDSSSNCWAGGTDLLNLYGVSGMMLNETGNTLIARKSWFMFDDEIVAMGTAITSVDNIAVETIVENRRLGDTGSNTFTVDGMEQPISLGWSAALSGISWAHLSGGAAVAVSAGESADTCVDTNTSADIGYYFPNTAVVKAVREARSGNWQDIDNRQLMATDVTRNYLTLWFEHGVNPRNSDYQYVLLPNRSREQVAQYASNPDIQVLINSPGVQAVKETKLGIIGANFWEDKEESVDLIRVNKKTAIMTREVSGSSLEVSLSDPTQVNTGTIDVELDRSASAIYTADSGISVTQLSPFIKFTVNVNGARGKTFKVSFKL
jgi:hyaluronate lyase